MVKTNHNFEDNCVPSAWEREQKRHKRKNTKKLVEAAVSAVLCLTLCAMVIAQSHSSTPTPSAASSVSPQAAGTAASTTPSIFAPSDLWGESSLRLGICGHSRARRLDDLEPVRCNGLQQIHERLECHRLHDVGIHPEIVRTANILIPFQAVRITMGIWHRLGSLL